MIEFSDRHMSRIVSTFAEVDELLNEAVHCLDVASTQSPFSRHAADVTPLQQQLIAHDAKRVRMAMQKLVERYGIPRPRPTASALQAGRGALDRAIVAIEELAPQYMCAFGALSDELEGDLNRIVSQLLDSLDSMEDRLARGSGEALRNRPLRLGQAARDSPLLQELARVIGAHNLVSLEVPLEALIERLETSDFEIAVYGRTNSGKSSLINFLLQQQILPVGATPVTAVPVRLTFGTQPWGYAQFADASPEKFVLDRLPEFATEHFNPGNARHVVRLRAELPAQRLKDGIALVDMPGFDSGLAAESTATFAVVPRCDLGIVVIDATDILTFEEATIVDTLHRFGSRALVLLTKADLLPPDERWRVHGQISRGLSSRIGVEVPVFFASTVSDDRTLRDDWVERGFEPELRERQALRQGSLRIKVSMLYEAVVKVLQRRLPFAAISTPSRECRHEAESVLVNVEALLTVAQRRHFAVRTEADRQAQALVEEVAHNAAVLWTQGHEPSLDITTLLRASLEARATGAARNVARELLRLRAQCSDALGSASAAIHVVRADMTDLPKGRGMPLFDDTQSIGPVVLPQPLLAFLGCWRRHAGARRWLAHSRVQRNVADIMTRYFVRVDEWRSRVLVELKSSFDACQRQLWMRQIESMTIIRGPSGTLARSITDDLDKLRRHADVFVNAAISSAHGPDNDEESRQ